MKFVQNINLIKILNNLIVSVFIAIISFFLFFASFIFIKPLYNDGPYYKLNIFMIFLNILSAIIIVHLVNFKNRLIKTILISATSIFIVFEVSSLYFLGNDIDTTFLINILDINFIKNGIKLRPYLSVLVVILFIIIFTVMFVLSETRTIKNKIIRFSISILPVFYLLSPFGFIYRVGYNSDFSYIKDAIKYGKYSYNDIFKMITAEDYVIRKDLISKTNGKNLVVIYLESFEQEYLYNEYLTNYTKFLKEISEENEFHFNIKQLEHANYTTAGIFTTMCGLPLNLYITNKNALKNNNNRIICIPNILKKSGYKQVFIGGAIGKLFYKKDLFNIFEYDEFYEKDSILNEYNNKLKLSKWGIYDVDMFNFAKEKYKELSKSGKPFNLTLLTLATHNMDGVHDDRCKNPDKIELANGIECTDNLLRDFIGFIREQPNFKNTLIIILPDHVQYNENTLKKFINDKNKKFLYTILINSNEKKMHNNDIIYTDLPLLIIDNLGIKTNAKFMYGNIDDKSMDTNEKINSIKKHNGIAKMFLKKIL